MYEILIIYFNIKINNVFQIFFPSWFDQMLLSLNRILGQNPGKLLIS